MRQTEQPARPLYTMIETADYLRVSKSSVQRAVNRGDLKPVKLGGRTLFRRADLDALIDRCAAQAS